MSATEAAPATDTDRKEFARLQAEAALQRGLVLERIDAGTGAAYLVSRWGLCRRCSTLAELAALLKRLGVVA